MGAQFTLLRIAEALGATLEGDPARVIRGDVVLVSQVGVSGSCEIGLEKRVRDLESGPHA